MKWLTAESDRISMAGEDALSKLDAAENLLLIHGGSDTDIVRVVLGEQCAWVGKYATSWGSGDDAGWRLLAIAPMDDIWSCDSVPRAAFFSAPWPASWVTRKKTAAYPPAASRTPATGLAVGSFVAGTLPNKEMRLAKVVTIDDDGAPVTVQWAESEPPSDARADGLKWYPVTKWPRGCEIEFRKNRGGYKNYWWFTILASQADKRGGKMAAKPAKAEKPAKRPKYDFYEPTAEQREESERNSAEAKTLPPLTMEENDSLNEVRKERMDEMIKKYGYCRDYARWATMEEYWYERLILQRARVRTPEYDSEEDSENDE